MVPRVGHRVPSWTMPARRLIAAIDDLARLAAETAPDPSALPSADELGMRRPADTPFLAWRARRLGLPPRGATPSVGGDAPDVRLWCALAEHGTLTHAGARTRGPAPYLDPALAASMGGVEVWTETELGALHALSWGAVLARDAARLATLLDHARWHIEHTQPDNATNRPGSIHLFLVLGASGASGEGDLYAQTLAHNCRVALGRPDEVSAQILYDAADWIGAAMDAGLIE